MSEVTDVPEQFAKLEPTQREYAVRAFEAIMTFLSSQAERVTPSIVATPGVCGGAPRIIRTRIPVWTLERMRQLGVSEADILRSFPTLRAVDLVQAWAYVDAHREDVERQIRENEED
jgi:uncharacterized protein (DUF433 family)